MSKIPFIAAFLLIILCSCRRQICDQNLIAYGFEGFDSTELSRIVLKKYQKNGGFSEVISTTNVRRGNEIDFRILAENDWEVLLPIADRSFKITNIAWANEKNMTTGRGAVAARCVDGFSCRINDQPFSKESIYDQYSIQYITLKK